MHGSWLAIVGFLGVLALTAACSSPEGLRGPDQAFLQGTFDQHLGIPIAGGSRYQQWLADQWKVAATEYLLLQRGLLGGLGEGNEEQSFQQYLAGRESGVSRMKGDFLGALTDMKPNEQVGLLESMSSNEQFDLFDGMGTLGDMVMQQVFLGSLQGRYPRFIAEARAAQAFSDSVKGAYAISPGALREENPIPFLNYLKDKYLLDD